MKRLLTLVVTVCLALPGVALAKGSNGCSSQNQTYGSQDCQVISNNNSRGSGNQNTTASRGVSSASTSSLPFTGLDVGLLLAGGGTLLGAGLVVRRLSGSAE